MNDTDQFQDYLGQMVLAILHYKKTWKKYKNSNDTTEIRKSYKEVMRCIVQLTAHCLLPDED